MNECSLARAENGSTQQAKSSTHYKAKDSPPPSLLFRLPIAPKVEYMMRLSIDPPPYRSRCGGLVVFALSNDCYWSKKQRQKTVDEQVIFSPRQNTLPLTNNVWHARTDLHFNFGSH